MQRLNKEVSSLDVFFSCKLVTQDFEHGVVARLPILVATGVVSQT